LVCRRVILSICVMRVPIFPATAARNSSKVVTEVIPFKSCMPFLYGTSKGMSNLAGGIFTCTEGGAIWAMASSSS
jgi:hypothetical protein